MARDLFTRQGDLTLQYFVYHREDQRRVAEKARHAGTLTCFKQSPDK